MTQVESQAKEQPLQLLLGNQATAIGLLDGGVRYFAAYPGTPSTEILEEAERKAEEYNAVVHWSTNEAVALEEAIGAAFSGKFAAFAAKHVGLNVAADPFLSTSYMGVPGALVACIADDPGMHSSQNEQDTRWYARLAHLPIIEPIDPQTAYDLVRKAIEISHKFETPIIFRLTTRISHGLGPVSRSERTEPPKLEFQRDPQRFVTIPAHARKNKKRHHKMWENLSEWVETSNLWAEYIKGSKIGIIATSVAGAYSWEAIEEMGVEVDLLIPYITYPWPKKKILEFLRSHDIILVAEELDDVFERELKLLAYEHEISTKIHGKDLLPWDGEFDSNTIKQGLAKILGTDGPTTDTVMRDDLIIPRPPTFCAGCPHRATYFALERVFKNKDVIYSSDIGCYSLGVLPPYQAADALVAMGASIGMGVGFAFSNPDRPVVALIGDSTFWHTGLPGLANALWHDVNLLLVVMDNGVTAMTGMQENPSAIDVPPMDRLSIEKTAEAMGAKVWVLDPFEERELRRTIKTAMNEPGVKVIVARRPCIILEGQHLKLKNESFPPPVDVDHDACVLCGICYEDMACPAIGFDADEQKVNVDQSLCTGCLYCAIICPKDAFLVVDSK